MKSRQSHSGRSTGKAHDPKPQLEQFTQRQAVKPQPVLVTRKCLWLVFSLWLIAGQVTAQPAMNFPGGGLTSRGVVIPLFSESANKPGGTLRLEKACIDYERKGFFRIGVLPIAVLQDVTLDLQDPKVLKDNLAQLNPWFGHGTARRLEFRQVKITMRGTVTNELEAARLRVLDAHTWEMLDSVSFTSATNRLNSQRALLHITGKQAGQLVIGTSPCFTNTFWTEIANINQPRQRNSP